MEINSINYNNNNQTSAIEDQNQYKGYSTENGIGQEAREAREAREMCFCGHKNKLALLPTVAK